MSYSYGGGVVPGAFGGNASITGGGFPGKLPTEFENPQFGSAGGGFNAADLAGSLAGVAGAFSGGGGGSAANFYKQAMQEALGGIYKVFGDIDKVTGQDSKSIYAGSVQRYNEIMDQLSNEWQKKLKNFSPNIDEYYNRLDTRQKAAIEDYSNMRSPEFQAYAQNPPVYHFPRYGDFSPAEIGYSVDDIMTPERRATQLSYIDKYATNPAQTSQFIYGRPGDVGEVAASFVNPSVGKAQYTYNV